jgi:hypothetical protein
MAAADPGRRQVAKRVLTDGKPCVCDPDRPCLWHYGQLPTYSRREKRRQSGVHSQSLGERR